jgi:lipopolysaccharide biosynthesis glycosyltransferase
LLKCARTQDCIFLDTDTLVMRDPREGWEFLPADKSFGIVCPNQQTIGGIKNDVESLQKRRGAYYREWRATMRVVDQRAKHFNTGVMYWRQSAYVKQLFADWHKEWLKFKQVDQLAFARAIHGLAAPDYVELPCRFNQLRPRTINPELVVFHGTREKWKRVRELRPAACAQGEAMLTKAGLRIVW